MFKYLCIGDSVLPGNVEDASEGAEMETVKPLFLTGIYCSDLTAT